MAKVILELPDQLHEAVREEAAKSRMSVEDLILSATSDRLKERHKARTLLPGIPPPPLFGFEKLERDSAWWGEHYDEMLRLYPERFVAVVEGNVVATDTDLFDLADRLKLLGIDIANEASIEWVSAIPRQL